MQPSRTPSHRPNPVTRLHITHTPHHCPPLQEGPLATDVLLHDQDRQDVPLYRSSASSSSTASGSPGGSPRRLRAATAGPELLHPSGSTEVYYDSASVFKRSVSLTSAARRRHSSSDDVGLIDQQKQWLL
jgi:hypothetical protein